MDENRVGEGTPGLPLAARRSINMLPRSGTREPPLWQANLSLAAKFRGPLLSGPLGSPCFRARYRETEKIKSVDPPPDTAAHTLPTTFATVFSPLRGGISFSGKSSESLTIFGGQRQFLACLSFSRGNVYSSTFGSRVYLRERNISVYRVVISNFSVWICGLVRINR